MGDVAELRLPCDAAAARTARRWLWQQVDDLHVAAAADVAELLLTELVTNAVVHAQTPSTVRLTRADGVLCVEVEDGSAIPPHQVDGGALAEGGRGLNLVEGLAQRWGWRRRAEGKVVWFCVSPGRADGTAPSA